MSTITQYLVQTSDYCWGRGDTLEEAIKQCRSNGSKVTKASRKVDYIVFEFNDEVKPESMFIDAMGTCRWELLEPRKSDDHNFKQGLAAEWIWQDGKKKPLADA